MEIRGVQKIIPPCTCSWDPSWYSITWWNGTTMGYRLRWTLIWNLILYYSSYIILGKSLNVLLPPLPHLWKYHMVFVMNKKISIYDQPSYGTWHIVGTQLNGSFFVVIGIASIFAAVLTNKISGPYYPWGNISSHLLCHLFIAIFAFSPFQPTPWGPQTVSWCNI